MRKAIVMALLVLLLASCTLDIRDGDGFRLFYSAGWSLQSYVVQSHDGYVVDGSIYHEAVFTEPVVVVNVLPRPISVRVWRGNLRGWITLDALDSLNLDPSILEE